MSLRGLCSRIRRSEARYSIHLFHSHIPIVEEDDLKSILPGDTTRLVQVFVWFLQPHGALAPRSNDLVLGQQALSGHSFGLFEALRS